MTRRGAAFSMAEPVEVMMRRGEEEDEEGAAAATSTSPDPRLQLEVPKPGLNPGSSIQRLGFQVQLQVQVSIHVQLEVPKTGLNPGLNPTIGVWSPDPILGKSQNYGFLHFWNGFVYLCTQK